MVDKDHVDVLHRDHPRLLESHSGGAIGRTVWISSGLQPIQRAIILLFLYLAWIVIKNTYWHNTLLKEPDRTTLRSAFLTDRAYGWKDDIWPIRPSDPWDISTDFAHPRKLTYQVTNGTWIRVDISSAGDLIFDMLGDLYCIPSSALRNYSDAAVQAHPILLGTPYDSDPHFSPSGDRIIFRSDAELGVENIWVMSWHGCEASALRTDEGLDSFEPILQNDANISPVGSLPEDEERRETRLRLEGRHRAYRITNETYRWVSDARFHPSGDKVIATKWYTSERSLGAGEGWVYDVPRASTPVEAGNGQRVVGRTLPFGWAPAAYGDQQIGPEQFIWGSDDLVIYAKNVMDERQGSFEYSKDVFAGIYAIFARNLTSGATETLVHASPGGASRPEISHDRRTLAFVRRVRDKETLALKDLVSGTISYVWYGLTYDLSTISAPMSTYPSFSFTPKDDAIIIWASGYIWRVPLKKNAAGETVAAGEPTKINFRATIEKRLAETRITKTDLKTEFLKPHRVYALKELSVNEDGSSVVFRAGGKTYHHLRGTESNQVNAVPRLLPNLGGTTYYSPAFVPHMTHLIIQARWSDVNLTTFELADLERQIAFKIVDGLPPGRYDYPTICQCEGLNRKIAFVRNGGDEMTGDIVATAHPGVYVGDITLPSPFGLPIENERHISLRNLIRVSDLTPTKLRFLDGADRLLVHSSKEARIIELKGRPTGDLTSSTLIAQGRMSLELAASPSRGTLPPAAKAVAMEDFFQIYVAENVAADQALWSKPGKNSTRGLARVSIDGGHDLAWSSDGNVLFWLLGPYLHSLKIKQLDLCRREIARDPITFGIDCVRRYVDFTEISITQVSELEQLRADQASVSQQFPGDNDAGSPDSLSDVLVLTNATLVTMETGNEDQDVMEGATLVIRGGLIEVIGLGVTIPFGAKVVNVEGGTVLPGFVDVHAHWGGASTVASSWEQLTFLAYGCTTMHNPSSGTVDTWVERARIESGDMIGPRIFTTGAPIYGAGDPEYHQDIATDDEAMSALIRLKVEGGPLAFSYKNYNLPSRASRQRLIKAAKKLGMNVYPEGGMNYEWDMTYILDGMTTVEHAIPIPKLYDDVLKLMALSGTGNTPTHIVNYGGLWGEDYVWAHEKLPFNKKLRQFVPHAKLERLSQSITAPRDAYQLFNTSASVNHMVSQGMNASIGAHGEPPIGLNYHKEMWFFAQGGMSPYEVLRSATRSGAFNLGLFDSIGSLSPGKLADMVVYPAAADVLQDISSTTDIRFVIKGGRVWDATDMTEVWPMAGRKPSIPHLNAD